MELSCYTIAQLYKDSDDGQRQYIFPGDYVILNNREEFILGQGVDVGSIILNYTSKFGEVIEVPKGLSTTSLEIYKVKIDDTILDLMDCDIRFVLRPIKKEK